MTAEGKTDALSNIKETLLLSKRRELDEIEDDLSARLTRKTKLEREGNISAIVFIVAIVIALFLGVY